MRNKLKYLRIALYVIGLIFLAGIYPLMMSWPSGWRWLPEQPKYEQMILGIYATLGIFLILAARKPMENKSLIWFTVWSSIVHASIMAIQAYVDPREHGHYLGDIPALYLIAIILALLMPKNQNFAEKH